MTELVVLLLQRMELERKHEKEQYMEACAASAQAALLMEKQQAMLKRQLRQQLDGINLSLAQAHRQQSVGFNHAGI